MDRQTYLKAVESHKGPRERPRLAKSFPGPSLAKQSFKKECDINHIMSKYLKTGLINHVAKYNGKYGESLPTDFDYQDACNAVLEAQEIFMSVPSDIRRKFNNDPAEFLEFVKNPENIEKMYEMGLAKRPSSANPDPQKSPSGEGVEPAADVETPA